MLATWIDDLRLWWATLSPEFVFLLGLPLLVAACGLAADAWARRRAAAKR